VVFELVDQEVLRIAILRDQEVLKIRGIFVNLMLRRKISNQLKRAQNISSHFWQPKKKTSILFDVKRVSSVKNKKKISMISSRLLSIDLVKKSKLGIFLRSKNFLIKSVSRWLASSASS